VEKRTKAWYVGERAELLARLFLQDLGAAVWATVQDEKNGPFDAIATFFTDDEKTRITAIEVKATEQPVGEEFHFQASLKSIRALQHSNVPVLFLVVDVKHNQVYYGWARDVRYDLVKGKGSQTVRCTLPVVAAPERRNELLNAILSQPDVAECAG
jgi:Holliday junction resolvase-like predicted endonuclease